MALDIGQLVAPEGGLVSRRIFADREVYEAEMRQVFGRSWLFLGHESQLAKPKDFFTAYMGEESVLVTRDQAGRIRAFLNTCRHRGMRVCRADAGNAAAFTCSYHAWTYGSDGSLIGVPQFKEAYYEELDRSRWGLIPVPRLESFRGLLFGNLDAGAVPLTEWLGDVAWYLDCIFDRRAGGTEVIGGIQKWTMEANWKFPSDNQVGDLYHVPFSHGSAQRVLGGGGNRDAGETFAIEPGGGHGLGATLADEGRPLTDLMPRHSPALDYMDEIAPEMRDRLGPVRARLQVIHLLVFPNFGLLPGPFTIRVWHPRGPDKVEIWSYCIVDKAAPPELKDEMRKAYILRFGPGGILEQDDGENWSAASAAVRGVLAGEYPFNYQMGAGHEGFHEDLPGRIARAPSELGQRGFYARWAAMMDGKT